MDNLKFKWYIIGFISLLLGLYGFLVRPIFIEELKNNAGLFFDLMSFWLPKFQEYVNQYGSQLIAIADSWAVRVLFALVLFVFFDKLILKGLRNFVRQPQTSFITRLQIILLSLAVSWYQWGMWYELAAQLRMEKLYQGLPVLGVIVLPLPSWEFIRVVQIVIIALPVLFLSPLIIERFRILPFILLVQGFLFLYLQALFLGFGKIDHTYATLNFSLIAFGFLIFNPDASWPVQSARVWVALAYFLAAIEKLTLSPWAWISGESLLHYAGLHITKYTPILKYHPWLSPPGSWFTLLFEAGLLISILIGRAHHWIVLGLIGFHVATWFLMDVGGGINNPWVMVLVILFVLPDVIITLSQDHRRLA